MVDLLSNLKVYVVHYSPFCDRRRHMEDQLQKHGLHRLPVNWILEHDREVLVPDMTHSKDDYSLSMISVILKHMVAFRAAAEFPKAYHLVLEDDVTLADGFLEKLEGCLKELSDDWDMLFVGSGQGMHVPWWQRRKDRRVYFRGWKPTWWGGGGASRCGEAYLIAPSFAQRFLDCAKAQPPYLRPIDWLMNEVGYQLHTRSWWCEPPLAFQGVFLSWTKHQGLLHAGASNRVDSRFRQVLRTCRQWFIAGFRSSSYF